MLLCNAQHKHLTTKTKSICYNISYNFFFSSHSFMRLSLLVVIVDDVQFSIKNYMPVTYLRIFNVTILYRSEQIQHEIRKTNVNRYLSMRFCVEKVWKLYSNAQSKKKKKERKPSRRTFIKIEVFFSLAFCMHSFIRRMSERMEK